jgi:hypothetical protein
MDLCKNFLVDLYLKTKTKSPAQRRQINELFPQRCIQYYSRAEKPEQQLNCFKLIRTFIHRFDGDHILEEDTAGVPQGELKSIQVSLNPDKVSKVVAVHPNQKLWQVKRKMATAYKLRLSEFYIKTKNGALEESAYDEQVKEYKIEQLHINRYTREEMEREFPRYLIGYNKEYLMTFLDLLKEGNEECKREVLSLLEILPVNLEYKLHVNEVVLTKIPKAGGDK